MIPKDLNATIIDTTSLSASSTIGLSTPVQIVPIRTSTPPRESVLSGSPDISALSKPEVTKDETETKIVPVSVPGPNNLIEIIHSLTNTSRVQNDLTALSLDTRLSALAQERSEEMINLRYFSHTTPSGCDLKCRLADSNYMTLTWGENLAESTSYKLLNQDELARMLIQKWLKSAGHRDNLFSNKFTHQGIGVAKNNDRIVVTVLFAAS